ncbi:MAG: hypothetical protein N0C84_00425 [Candidatus Thiodiazotropha taylori]|uniref:superoxide dismutase n=1 Tax=Candidatus Thiodiazotropha taylori TaxID=2792791 RepID=A0A9E4K943_9GAMM|nr:hypothetical protein [Candidatus Thiodiazotropha taylori]MCW4254909.1 hypothetical protein [Candidatus Thiodiazotropha taylori]
MKLVDINYDISGLKSVIDPQSFEMHYNKVYKNHISCYNESSNDIPFHKAGAYLHELYFENIRGARQDNYPTGKVAQIIIMRYGSFENFVKTCEEQITRLQGSGWIFMNSAGYINIIPNNRIVKDIALIIDFWEHAYLTKFGTDRISYFRNHLSIINWNVVNQRIIESKKKDDKL